MSGTKKRKLPQGWTREKLKDICTVNPNRTKAFKRAENLQTSFVPMDAIDEAKGTISKRLSREYAIIAKGYTHFEEGDVLFAKITPCMQNGKSAVANGLIDGIGFGSTEFHVLRPKAKVTKEWLFYFVRTSELRNRAEANFEGSAGQQRVPKSFLENALIPLPATIREQSEITNNLSSKMTDIEKIRRASLRQKEATEAMQGAILREIFPFKEGDVLPDGWKWSALGRITANIQYGISKGSSQTPSGPKLLRITDIQNGNVDWSRVPYCECNDTETRRYLLQDGDIVFVRTGATTGKSFLINAPDNALFASYLIRVQCDHNLINPTYLYSFFQSPIYWNYISKGSRGGTLAGFNATMLSKMRIPYPVKLDDQISIANMFAKKMMNVEKIRMTANRQLEAIEAMPAAMLREVFDFDSETGAAI